LFWPHGHPARHSEWPVATRQMQSAERGLFPEKYSHFGDWAAPFGVEGSWASGRLIALRLRVLLTHRHGHPVIEGRLTRCNPAVSIWSISQFSHGGPFGSQ
jgi:hypothetical protein